MSQLQFPRLHFRGGFTANVGTANNDTFGGTQCVDSVNVRVDTGGKTDAAFAQWLREIEPGFGLRGGWNIFGNGSCRFNDTTCHATETAFGSLAEATAADPVVGANVRLGQAIMVDQDPEGSTSTQIFAMEFNLSSAGIGLLGRPSRAYSRWVTRRNLGVSGFRAFAAVWHSVIPPELLTITPGASPSLLAFQAAKATGHGLLVRYCTYLLAPLIAQDVLAADFAAGTNTPNPAIGKVIGTVGIWKAPAMTSLADGRRLRSGASATVDHVNFTLNPATVWVDAASKRISVDLVNSIPEVNDTLEKVNVGPLDLTLTYESKGKTETAVIGPIVNTRIEYERRAGLVDFQVTDAVWPHVADGRLAVVQQSTSAALLVEAPLVLETDDRATYLQQEQPGTVHLRGWQRGAPAAGVRVSIRQFSTSEKTFAAVPPATPVATCPDHIDLDASGRATIDLTAVNPGCCTLHFSGSDDPGTEDYFACVRVLPKDDFSKLAESAIDFPLIYTECLQYYHLLHPIMDKEVDLSVQSAVEGAADFIRTRIRDTPWDDFSYMPRTRDLSKGKIDLLIRWCDIVIPPIPLLAPPTQ